MDRLVADQWIYDVSDGIDPCLLLWIRGLTCLRVKSKSSSEEREDRGALEWVLKPQGLPLSIAAPVNGARPTTS